MVGQDTAGTNPFSLGREKITFSSDPEKGKKEDPPFGTCARGKDDGNSRKQNDECKIHKRQDCSDSTLGAMDKTQFRKWLYFQTVKPDSSDPPQCSSNHRSFPLCFQRHSRLFPLCCV